MRPSAHTPLTDLARAVRLSIYRQLAATALAPDASWLAHQHATSLAEVEVALDELAAQHAIALEPGGHRIRMAHPFSARPVGYPVEAGGRVYQANCAWDALGIPSLLDRECTAGAPCPDCGEPLSWRANGTELLAADPGVLHFGVPACAFWDDIDFT